jgi:PAS domain S-box-containing protein
MEMMETKFFYSAPFVTAAVLMVGLAVLSWRRRRVAGARVLLSVCLAAAIWAAAEGLLYLGFSTRANIGITYFQYLGIAALPPLTLIFVLILFDFPEQWVRRCSRGLLPASAAAVLLVWTNGWHGLVYVRIFTIDTGRFPMLGLVHGPLWWLIITYNYTLLTAVSLLLLWRVVDAVGIYRVQAAVILAAVVAVWAANLVYITGRSPVANMDPGPIAFLFVAAAITWSFFRVGLLDVLPVAKTAIFDGIGDAIVVTDSRLRAVHLNPAARALFGVGEAIRSPMPLGQLCENFPQLKEALDGLHPWREAGFEVEGWTRTYDVRLDVLRHQKGATLGHLLTLRDISERKRIEQALEQRNQELAQRTVLLGKALSEVRELSGLLPICAHCKKIRDDQGYWTQLEDYLTRHSKAHFTHSVCPECLKAHYPEMRGPQAR